MKFLTESAEVKKHRDFQMYCTWTSDKSGTMLARRVNALLDKQYCLEPTVIPLMKLLVFNQLTIKPDSNPPDIAIATINNSQRILANEILYASKAVPLPTVGLELELPLTLQMGKYIDILSIFCIPNYDESGPSREVNFEFSYSPLVQALLVNELIYMGIVEGQMYDETTSGKLSNFVLYPYKPISKHVNFGIPFELDEVTMKRYASEVKILVDNLTYAYVSGRRIMTRKSNASYYVRKEHVKESLKTKGCRLSEYDPELLRLEIKTGELKDNHFAYELFTSQALCAMLFAYIKCRVGLRLTNAEANLAGMWETYREQVYNISMRYFSSISAYERPDRRADVSKILEGGDVVEENRAIIDNIYPQIYRVIFHN